LKRDQRQKSAPDKQNTTGWLTTFNDLVTLLMVFFVLMFSMSTIDAEKMADFQYALQSGLGILEEGIRVGVQIKEEQPIVDMSHIKTQAEGGIKTTDVKAMQRELAKALESLDSGINIDVIFTEQGARLGFDNAVLFELGQAVINPQGYPFLNELAAVMKKMSYPIRIEGHTDNVPIHTWQFPSNWELSTARAVNVVKYFSETCGIDPRRLSAVGYGESKPLVANDSPQNRAKNRRVEIVLIKEDMR